MQKVKMHGLVGDLWPNIRLMQLTGHWLLEYHEDSGGMGRLLRLAYCWLTTVLVFVQYGFLVCFLLLETYNADEMAAVTITTLFFLHSVTKFTFFALRSSYFYRTLGAWNQVSE